MTSHVRTRLARGVLALAMRVLLGPPTGAPVASVGAGGTWEDQ